MRYNRFGIVLTLSQRGKLMLKNYHESSSKALKYLLPEIRTRSEAPDLNQGRRMFNEIAVKRGFDPLITENWYSLPPSYVEKYKVSAGERLK